MAFNKISVIAHTIRVLLLFIRKQRGRQNVAVGTPHIAPVVLPRLYRVGGEVEVVLRAGIDKARYVDLIIVIGAVLNISGKGAVAAVIRPIGFVICPVLIDGVALLQCLIERSRPLLSILVKAKLVHQFIRIKMLDLYRQGRHNSVAAILRQAERREIRQARFAEIPNKVGTHGIEVLSIGCGVDSDDP